MPMDTVAGWLAIAFTVVTSTLICLPQLPRLCRPESHGPPQFLTQHAHPPNVNTLWQMLIHGNVVTMGDQWHTLFNRLLLLFSSDVELLGHLPVKKNNDVYADVCLSSCWWWTHSTSWAEGRVYSLFYRLLGLGYRLFHFLMSTKFPRLKSPLLLTFLLK